MAFTDDSCVPELPLSDDDNSSAFEYLPDDLPDDRRVASVRFPAPTPSPPPPPPPSPPVLPFRNAQRVRVKSVNLPPEVNASKTQSTRRATTSEAAVSGSRTRTTSTLGSRAIPSQAKASESRSRGSVATSILCPDAATSKSQQKQECEVEPKLHSASSPSLIPVPSIHPIDTLSKKLRQQAEELTRVYEQLETQRERLASYKSESQAQKLEIERLKLSLKHQRDERSAATASSRRTAASSASTSGTKLSSGGRNATKTTLDRKVKEAEQERQRYAAAAKQLEAVVADAQHYFHDRRRTNGEGDDSEDSATLATPEDQRMYIRVLEEVVHLKASEFQVSSHEELLVVLAELRHTIYEQEKEIEQQSQRARDTEAQLLEEKQFHLQVREQLDRQRRECADVSSTARTHEAEMRQQILSVQRELQQHRDQLHQALTACSQLQERERDLEKRLARETSELEATRTRLDHSVSSCDKINDKLSQATAKADDATRQAKHWEVEAARRQTHLDEMNALQEELLDSIAEASSNQERASERAKQLEQDLCECVQREREAVARLDELVGRTDSERRQLKQRLDELKLLNEQMDTQCSTLREQTQALDESLEMTQRQLQEHVERAEKVQRQLDMREKEVAEHREAAAQMEAALAAALQVIATSGASNYSMNTLEASGEKCLSDDDDGVGGSSDDNMIDATAIEAVRVCCAALDSLLPSGDETPSPWPDVMVPSLRELLVQLALSGTRLVSEMEQSRESWARERRNLREACFTLEEASRVCQLEVDQRHRQLLDCERALADRGLQVDVMAIQSEALADQFAALQAVFEEKRGLEQRTGELENQVERCETVITTLEDELYTNQSEKDTLAVQLQDVQRQLEHQNKHVGELDELRKRVRVLSSELDDALALSEEQNEWNQQLASEAERQEQAALAHNALIRELEARGRAFTRRFTQVFEQFAVDSELAYEQGLMSVSGDDHDTVLKRLQAFPLVVEQYIARSSVLGIPGHVRETVHDTEEAVDFHRKSSARRRNGTDKLGFELEKGTPRLQETGEPADKLDEQLELIRAAFQAIRK